MGIPKMNKLENVGSEKSWRSFNNFLEIFDMRSMSSRKTWNGSLVIWDLWIFETLKLWNQDIWKPWNFETEKPNIFESLKLLFSVDQYYLRLMNRLLIWLIAFALEGPKERRARTGEGARGVPSGPGVWAGPSWPWAMSREPKIMPKISRKLIKG